MANFSRKLEDNNGRNFAQKFAVNYRTKIRGEVPRAANFRSKIRGVETIGVTKMRRNIAEISFRANFRRKARKFVEIRLQITFAQYCTLAQLVEYRTTVREVVGSNPGRTKTQDL